MTNEKEIALICRINAGGFSGERVVEVTRADGTETKILAPRHYCWTKDGRPLAPDEPTLGHPIDGLVAARRLRVLPNSHVVVNTPDGEVFAVLPVTIAPRPTTSEITSHVPV
jgi:hypothetical protein